MHRFLPPPAVWAFAAAVSTILPATALSQPPEPPATPREHIRFSESTQRGFDRSGQFVTAEKLPDGSVHARQNGSFQNVSVARMGPDGKIETFCTTNGERARDWMSRQDGRPGLVDGAELKAGDPK